MNPFQRFDCGFKSMCAHLGFIAMMISLPGIARGASSVSQFGITWNFSEDRTVGQYANGDWWVIGPVTITSISPASSTVSGWTPNGTMINPAVGPAHGFDSSIVLYGQWNPVLNVAPAFTGKALSVAANTSVVSVRSKAVAGNSSIRPQLLDGAILTVVGTAPAAGSFRPPLVGSDKTHRWNKANLNYGILKKYGAVTGTPALTTVESYFERPWFAQMEGPAGRYIAPANNMPEYGRDQAQTAALGLLSLHLNYTDAQKEKLYIRLVQYGIDIYGAVRAGLVYSDNGGHNAGRKTPMLLAGLALGDSDILSYANASKYFVFQEDRQTWVVTPSDVGRTVLVDSQSARETYTQSFVGLPEWGEKHTGNLARDDSRWGPAIYRWIGGAWLGHVLAARLTTGGMEAWNYPPLFNYCDRYWQMEGSNGYSSQTFPAPNNISPFVYNMWAAYRSGGTPGTNPPPVEVLTFAVGDRISLSANTNVRASASLTGTLLGTQSAAALGTIIGGPVTADNTTWWNIDYDSGADGWCGVDNLLKSSTPVPTTPFAVGDRIQLAANTNVRASAALTGTLLGSQSLGALGTIVGGPVLADGVTWWQMNYDSGVDGWSGVDNFRRTVLEPVPPTPPQGLRVIE